MKYTILFFSVLSVFLVNQAKAVILQEDTMDTTKTSINLLYGSSSSRILKSHSHFSYTVNRNKTLFVTAPPNYSLMVSIKYIDLRPNSRDILTLYSLGRTAYPVRYSNTGKYRKRVYYPEEEQTYFVQNGQLGVNFYTGPGFDNIDYDGFQLTYTVQGSPTYCNSGDFVCTNGMCIANILKCDGHNHCGDGSSLRNCFIPIPSSGKTIGSIFGSIFLVIAIACAVFLICRRRRGSAIETQVITSHPPPSTNLPSYPPVNSQTGANYPPPPPPYSQGITNQGYH